MPHRHYGKWRARWLDENGDQQSATFDDFKSADYHENKKKAEVCEIRRGLRAPDPPEKLFDDLADYWIEKRAPRKRSCKDDESIIRAHLRPAFGLTRVPDIGVEDVDEYVSVKVDGAGLSDKTVANHVTLLTTMLKLATTFKQPWLLAVPKFNKPKVSLFSRDYRYLRSADEIARFLSAARDEGDQVFTLYAVALYTGMRAGEIAALQRDDVDFDRQLITVQRSFNGPTKSDRVRYVPILTPLVPVLRQWMVRAPGRLVFTNRDDRMYGESARIFQEILHRVLDATGFPKSEKNGKTHRYVVFHDLRHTFASSWVAHGGDIFRLQKILGHQSIQMTMRYAHLAPDAFKDDYDRLGTCAPTMGEVLVLPRKSPAAE
jgi:integrase